MAQDVISAINPFKDNAEKYRKAGWLGTLPLPYREKNPPPTSFTGHAAPHPTQENIDEWCASGKRNICFRLAGVDTEHEIVGIDVDHYIKGEKVKKGGDQLRELEDRLGNLPETWISSARTDGFSGIRYFRVPRGFAFRGQVAKDIECISKGYRFAVAPPSIHPDGMRYWWFPPGVELTKEGRKVWDANGEIPDARNLPLLPDTWLEYLTQGKMRGTASERIDMDTSVDDVYQWADDTFHDIDGKMCSTLRKKLELHLKTIDESSTAHDKITNAHWNITQLAKEGHVGWTSAINALEEFYRKLCIERDKRGMDEVRGEIFRSRIQALRKIKAQCEDRISIGAPPVDPCCQETGACGSGRNDISGISFTVQGDEKHNSDVSQYDAIDGTNNKVGGVSSGNGSTAASHGSAKSDSGTAGNNSGKDDAGQSGDSSENSDPSNGDGGSGEFKYIRGGGVKGVPEYEMNDDGNGQHFVDMFTVNSSGSNNLDLGGPSVRWVEGYGWIVWRDAPDGEGGPRWERDETGDGLIRRMWQKVKQRQQNYADACYANYIQLLDQFTRQVPGVSEADVKIAKTEWNKWSRFAEISGNNRNAENALKAAKSIRGVAVDLNDLDKNPLLLGVKNGVVELDREHVRLRRAVPNDYITLNTGTAWEEPSKLAQNIWDNYLETFLPDLELRRAVQIALGHCLIGGNPEKIMLVLKGGTNTGKSTMIAAIENALGDYAGGVDASVFSKIQNFNSIMLESLPKRIVACSEFDEHDKLSASQIKRFTGGVDMVTCQVKYSNATVRKIPQWIPVLATNETPTILGADKAIRYRLYVIPFDTRPDHLKKESSNQIKNICGPAVLNWLIEGFIEYRRLGKLPEIKAVKDETDEFVSELDEFGAFLRECVVSQTNPQGYVSRKAMYDRFDRWWLENHYQQRDKPSMTKFTQRLRALGIETPRSKMRINGEVSHYWTGVKLLDSRSNVVQMPNLSDAKVVQTGTSGTDDE